MKKELLRKITPRKNPRLNMNQSFGELPSFSLLTQTQMYIFFLNNFFAVLYNCNLLCYICVYLMFFLFLFLYFYKFSNMTVEAGRYADYDFEGVLYDSNNL